MKSKNTKVKLFNPREAPANVKLWPETQSYLGSVEHQYSRTVQLAALSNGPVVSLTFMNPGAHEIYKSTEAT